MIKIGLLGCGGIAYYHAAGYLEIAGDAQVVAISDVMPARAEKLACFLGGEPRTFSSFQELIAESDVDAVDICLPHYLHKDAIVAAAATGKHILCEKPLCMTLDEASEIEHAIKQSGVTLMCAHNQLFDPAIRQAKKMLSDGVLGRIFAVRTVDAFITSNDPAVKEWSWRAKKETMGGGELIDTGYHPSYMLLYLAATAPVEVTAMLGKYHVHVIDAEDSAQVLVRFADTSVGNIVSSWAHEVPAGAWQFQVIGEHGQIYGRGHRLYYKPHGFEPTMREMTEVNTFHAEVSDFVACLHDKRAPVQTEIDGINVLKIILAAYRSDAEKRTILL